ncbi:hypothetical protein DF40_009215 [Stenotrophomonas maltophilia M30]|nr:hypothetical protein DF40_009215 [Stenotrophomonas maltophilia M30]
MIYEPFPFLIFDIHGRACIHKILCMLDVLNVMECGIAPFPLCIHVITRQHKLIQQLRAFTMGVY